MATASPTTQAGVRPSDGISRVFGPPKMEPGYDTLLTLLQEQSEERRAIARELHDQIGQSLTVLLLSLDKAMNSPGDQMGANLAGSKLLVKELMARVRNLTMDLRPEVLDDQGLLPALQWQFRRFADETTFRVRFEYDGLCTPIEPEVSLTAYRIVQEALTNVMRHSGVSEATVFAKVHDENLWLRIEDHGKGFDASALPSGLCTGLDGMKERAQVLGGQFHVSSSHGKGTTVTARLPLRPRQLVTR